MRADAVLTLLNDARDLSITEEEWATVLARGVPTLRDGVVGVRLYEYRVDGTGFVPIADRGGTDVGLVAHKQLDCAQKELLYGSGAVALTLSSAFPEDVPDEVQQALNEAGLPDIAGLHGPQGDGFGLAVLMELCKTWGAFSAAEEQLWKSIACHLAVSRKVRQMIQARGPDLEIHPGGRCLHARDDDAARAAGEVADAATRLHAGGRSRAEDGLALWDELLRGGWYIATQFGLGGHHRIVAVRLQAPEARALSRLSQAERAVAEHVADGLANREVAAQLNVPVATVATRLRRALRKLGLRRRMELIRLARRLRQPIAA